MNTLLIASIDRYHEKIAGNFIGDWIKKNFDLPSKEKAIKLIKKHIKSKKDLEEVYSAMPKMINFLKSKKADVPSLPAGRIFPAGFVRNLAILVAMISILGNMYSKEAAYDKLVKQDIIQREKVLEDAKLLGKFKLTKDTIKKVKQNRSQEEMNKVLIDDIKAMSSYNLRKVNDVKYPLELKFTSDQAGHSRIYPSKLNNYEGESIYVHREYTLERYKEIEKNLKEFDKNEKI